MGILNWFSRKKSLQSVQSGRGWTSLFVQEPYSGAWQKNDELKLEEVSAFYAVFSCVSLIAKDIGKMPITLKRKQDGVMVDAEIPKKVRALSKPNNYQTWQQFSEQWTTSLLLRGNTYVLKVRDAFGEIYRMVVLNPDLVTPLVDDYGNVFYQLNNDRLTQTEAVVIPASEIIHDRINCFYHPLVGLTPIIACGLASSMGLNILKNASTFFGNGSRPGGILVAPGSISEEKAKSIGEAWNANYSGANVGKTAVLGDDMKYITLAMNAADSQMIEQLKMSAEIVCSVFHMPPFKIGIGTIPAGQKVGDSSEIYYSDCLQSLIEARENLLDDGLDLKSFGLEAFLDLETLIRMDSSTQMQRLKEGVGAAIMTPNEARRKIGYGPLVGGDTVYMQQQNFSLDALSKRDAKEDPFSTNSGAKTDPSQPQNNDNSGSKMLYQGIFKPENQYAKGCFVTHKGSLWHCENEHSGEFSHENFKLAQKKWEDA